MEIPSEELQVHEISGGSPAAEAESEPPPAERLDELADRYFEHPGLWKLLAAFNGIAHPLRLASGYLLKVPPIAYFTGDRR